MFQSIRQSWRQSLAALMFAGAVSASDDSALFAADDPFAEKTVAKKDAEQDRPSVKDEDEDDEKSAKGKRDEDDDRRDKRAAKGDDDDEFRPKKIAKDREDSDDDKRSAKRKESEKDDDEQSLDQLRAKLKQLEADNAKLRSAIEAKDAALGIKKSADSKGHEKLPPIKSTKAVEPPQKGGEKQPDEQQQIAAKLKGIQEQIGHLQKEGRKEEAEKLMHAAQELQHLLAERQAKHGKEPQKEHASIAKRIEQLKQEIEESARAGQKERVEALKQELQKTMEHGEQLQRKGFIKPDLKSGPDAPHELGAVIKQLAEEVQRLRAEVNELRSLVKDRGDDRKK